MMMKTLRYFFALWLAVAAICLMPLAAQEKKDAAPEQPEVQLTTAQLEAVSGQYVDKNEPDEPANYSARDGKLYIESYRTPGLVLKALSATEFEITQYKVKVKFALDASGHGESVTIANAPESSTISRTRLPE